MKEVEKNEIKRLSDRLDAIRHQQAETGRGEVSESTYFWKAFFKLILEISSVSERTIVDRTACW